jgi:hypothetical protein
MINLLKRYGFLDGTGCVNHKHVKAQYLPLNAVRDSEPDVPSHLKDSTGVPQYFERSGVCWFAALCTCSFSDPQVRNFMKKHMPEEVRTLCDTCLFKREDSQKLRNYLWDALFIGDNIYDRPENDGCNGFSELTLLCAKLKIPLMRYLEKNGKFQKMSCKLRDKGNAAVHLPEPCLSKPHLLVLRFNDGDHHSRFPILRRIVVHGKRYKWVGCFAGQRKCGHQIGIASSTGRWRDIVLGDADLHKDGIGPVFVTFNGPEWKDHKKWWGALEYIVHVTKFGPTTSDFCNLSPHNLSNDSLDKYRGVGSNSLDLMYFSDTEHH